MPNDNFSITILSRLDSVATFLESEQVRLVRVEFTLENLVNVFHGHDAVVHASGIAGLSTQKIMIEAAVQAGVQRFVLNEFANSPTNQVGLPELEPFRVMKKEFLQLAERKATENPNFSWSALATGNFLDFSLSRFPQFGIDVANKRARLVDGGLERFSAVVLEDIGIAVRGILRRPEETKNRFCHIRSVETCQREILDVCEEATGVGWTVEDINGVQMYERGKQAWARGEVSGRFDLLVVQLFQKGMGRSIVVGRDQSDNALLDVREKDAKGIVEDVLRSF